MVDKVEAAAHVLQAACGIEGVWVVPAEHVLAHCKHSHEHRLRLGEFALMGEERCEIVGRH
jgi:hypothetical protein